MSLSKEPPKAQLSGVLFCYSVAVMLAAANAATDQILRIQRIQNAGQSTVTLSVGVHHLGENHTALLHVIHLERLSMPKVLEDLSIFVSHCNSHHGRSFRFCISLIVGLFETAFEPADRVVSIAKPVVVAFNPQRAAVYQLGCEFLRVML